MAGIFNMINKKSKAMFSLIISVCVVLAMSVQVSAATFSDIEGHWAQAVIEAWSNKGVIQGYEGKFNPDNNITRGDMAVILDRLMGYSEKSENTFLDLDKHAYYADAVLKLNRAGIMLGADGKVRPQDSITREEAFAMLNRIYQFKGTAKTTGFLDETEVSDWALADVLALCENKIVNGSDGKINPKLYITRAEVLQLLENITTFLGNVSGSIEEELEIDFENNKNTHTSGNTGINIGGGTSNSGSNSSVGDNITDAPAQDTDNDDAEQAIGGTDIEAGGIW